MYIPDVGMTTHIQAGKMFGVASGVQLATQATTVGIALFNRASFLKTVAVFSIQLLNGNDADSTDFVAAKPADYALGTPLPTHNKLLGGPTSQLVCSLGTNLTASGTVLKSFGAQLNQVVEVMTAGQMILFPYAVDYGLCIFLTIAGAGYWGINVNYLEY